jgi:hypothetical protein
MKSLNTSLHHLIQSSLHIFVPLPLSASLSLPLSLSTPRSTRPYIAPVIRLFPILLLPISPSIHLCISVSECLPLSLLICSSRPLCLCLFPCFPLCLSPSVSLPLSLPILCLSLFLIRSIYPCLTLFCSFSVRPSKSPVSLFLPLSLCQSPGCLFYFFLHICTPPPFFVRPLSQNLPFLCLLHSVTSLSVFCLVSLSVSLPLCQHTSYLSIFPSVSVFCI